MIDSLEMLRGKIENQKSYLNYGLKPGGYGVVTLHRPSNVDNPEILKTAVRKSPGHRQRKYPSCSPFTREPARTWRRAICLPPWKAQKTCSCPQPLGYTSFMNLVFNCAFVITDSGGIQEETSYLGIPCLTVRENTERPVTITHGTNRLCRLEDLKRMAGEIIREKTRKPANIELWDGHTADRIVTSIAKF